MPCIRMGNAIVCTRSPRHRFCSCGAPADLLCDYPLRGTKAGKTCDRPICGECAVNIGPDKDLCPTHARMEGKGPWEKQQLG
jgi:hypothetical protein